MNTDIKKNRMMHLFRTYGIILVVLLLSAMLAIATPAFRSNVNLINIIRQVSINGILAIGMTFVVLTGGIDLSVGSILALSGVFCAAILRKGLGSIGLSMIVAILAALLTGLAFGLFNGYFVAYRNAPPFVTSLATMSITRGLTYLFTDGKPISNLPDAFLELGTGSIAFIPIPTWILLLVFVIGAILLRYMGVGRHIYAVGGNEKAALVSGIRVKRTKMLCYAISGILCGVAAVVLTSRVSSASPKAGEAYEMDAIAATVIGGTSLSGGKGRLWGTLVGALLLGIVSNGLDLLKVSPYIQPIVKGVIILLAVLADTNSD